MEETICAKCMRMKEIKFTSKGRKDNMPYIALKR